MAVISDNKDLEVVDLELLVLVLLSECEHLAGECGACVGLALVELLAHPDGGTVTIEIN